MSANEGYIYVLTNPSFPEYVKIGYADNVETRVNQLNRSECTPFAFRIYATLHVTNRLADKNIHKIIDKYKPELRAKENIKGKMRIREFFAMTANEAVDLLEAIGNIYGETPCVYEQTKEEKNEEKFANDNAINSERNSPFSFYKCGIKNGSRIAFANNPEIVCTVVGERKIQYNGKITSLSALAKKLLNKSNAVQGTLYFTYEGEILSALRKRLEDEGKYNSNVTENDTNDTNVNNSLQSDADLLYFNTKKYKAICQQSEKGYLLLKGSKILEILSPYCKESIKTLRDKYSSYISKDYTLTQDILFKSSSAAASFIAGTSLNGKICWKNKDGISLKNL